jgi:hypothetical protein
VPFRRNAPASHFNTDDPVACEEFLCELLDRGLRIQAIHHEGVDVPKHDFDKMVKTAASLLAARRICASLGIKPEEERFRFGYTA